MIAKSDVDHIDATITNIKEAATIETAALRILKYIREEAVATNETEIVTDWIALLVTDMAWQHSCFHGELTTWRSELTSKQDWVLKEYIGDRLKEVQP